MLSDSPVYETLTLKFFSACKLYQEPERIISLTNDLLSGEIFRSSGSFQSLSYSPLIGSNLDSSLTTKSLKDLQTRVQAGEVRSFSIGLNAEFDRVRSEMFMMKIDAGMPPLTDGMNRLSVYLTEGSWKAIERTRLFALFCELALKFRSCYGFSSLHIDSADSFKLDELYVEIRKRTPIDYQNSNRYIWDSEKFIKDIGWLNFLTSQHVEAGCNELLFLIKKLPFFAYHDNGVSFGVAGAPDSSVPEVLKDLRLCLAPIIRETPIVSDLLSS